jgi:ABC-type nitrate/sulfonate/bicarbonate transport system substrate-binding protein
MPPAAREVLVLLACLAAGFAASQDIPLRYGQAPSAYKSVYSLPIAVAQRHGFFRANGVDFRMVVPLDGGADRMVADLHDGTFDLMHIATPFLVRANLAGSDVVAIAAEFANPIYSLIARPDVSRIEALKGRTVGLADPGGSITYSMRKLFARHGLGEGDLQVKTIEGTPSRLGCLRRGECDAVPLGQPQDMLAIAEGFRLLGRSSDVVPPYVYTVTAARRSWAASHPEAVVRYVRALAAAQRAIADPNMRSSIAATLAEATDVPLAIAESVLRLYAQPGPHVIPSQAEIDPQGIRQVIAFMGEAGQLKGPMPDAARFIDLRYLQAAGIR